MRDRTLNAVLPRNGNTPLRSQVSITATQSFRQRRARMTALDGLAIVRDPEGNLAQFVGKP